MRAAVIGAGLAGASVARSLAGAGVEPVLFDKGRGPGGRLSTRRAETPLGPALFDHGAQYVTAQDAGFRTFLEQAGQSGAACRWQARLVSIDRGGNEIGLDGRDRWIGRPGMNMIVKTALTGFEPHFGARVMKLGGEAGAWTVCLEDGREAGPFARVAVTAPPAQLIDLLARSPGEFSDMIAEARAARMAPCWAVMAVFRAPFGPGFDGARMFGGALRWMARMNARPDYEGPEAWVLQASPDWSQTSLEGDPDRVCRALAEEAHVRFGFPAPVWSAAHRWRYARAAEAPASAFALDESGTLGCAGDWRLGPRAESAWLSGQALGAALSS